MLVKNAKKTHNVGMFCMQKEYLYICLFVLGGGGGLHPTREFFNHLEALTLPMKDLKFLLDSTLVAFEQ